MNFSILLILLSVTSLISSSKILFMTLIPQHWNIYFELGNLLKRNQHEISFLSYQNDVAAFQKFNFNVYVVQPELNLSLPNQNLNEKFYKDLHLKYEDTLSTLNALPNWCSLLLNDSKLLNQIKEKQFDIFIVDLFVNDLCSIAWAKKLEIPIIGVWPFSLGLPISYHLDLPSMTAAEYTTSTFFQRVNRMLEVYNVMKKWHSNYYQPMMAVINQYSQEAVTINHLHDELVLIMTNENPILEFDRPALLHVASIGGFHCQPVPNPLPKIIEDFAKPLRSGIIHVSLDFELPKNLEETLGKSLSTFSSHAIIWKRSQKDGKVSNIYTIPDVNQQDILGNPRTRLFISSCDSMGTMSAIFHGVPILCIFKDLRTNLASQVVDKKIGLGMQLDHITIDSLSQNINKLLTDKSYYQNLRQLSIVFRDQPEVPSDRFVFWVEHVLRHKSAPLHAQKIRFASAFYYNTMDIVVLVVIFFLIILCIVVLISIVLSKFMRPKTKGKSE